MAGLCLQAFRARGPPGRPGTIPAGCRPRRQKMQAKPHASSRVTAAATTWA